MPLWKFVADAFAGLRSSAPAIAQNKTRVRLDRPRVLGTAEIPLVISEELSADGKLIPTGARVGITTPLTGFRPFAAWLRQAHAQFGPGAVVPVGTRTKPGVKPWGIPAFAICGGAE